MGRPRRAPAFLVDATVRRSAKLAALSNDTARLGFFYAVLAGAKLGDTPGRFASRSLFREVAGRFARYLGEYLEAGILEAAPTLCDRCQAKTRTDPPADGVLIVHDWHEHQYNPGKLDRDRVYEDGHPNRPHGSDDAAISVGVSGAQSGAVSGEFPAEFPSAISHARHPRNVEHPPGRTNGLTGTPAKRGARVIALVDPVETIR
jgi:hypothetical protein